MSVIFDGTSPLGEALAVVVRFISDEFTIEQCLVKLQMLAKSMKGNQRPVYTSKSNAHLCAFKGVNKVLTRSETEFVASTPKPVW